MKKRILKLLVVLLLTLGGIKTASAQTYVKLNGLYALAGVFNPSVEFPLSNHFTFNTEFIGSPWKSINGKPFLFAMSMVEARWHVKENYNGWYFAGSIGFHIHKMQKDEVKYDKGWGHIYGINAGYQWQVKERWLLEAFFGVGFQNSWYEGYRPETHEKYVKLNESAEYLPYKIGFSVGYKICDPKRKKKR